jgi:serine protease
LKAKFKKVLLSSALILSTLSISPVYANTVIPANESLQAQLALTTTDQTALDTLANSRNDVVRVNVAKNQNTSPSTLSRMIKDGNDYVRVFVSQNRNTSNADLQIMMADGNSWVSKFATEQLIVRGVISLTPSPTPTPTVSKTPSPTPLKTITASPTPSVSKLTTSPSPTPTASKVPTPSPTPTPSSSSTKTISPRPTPTPSLTQTFTPSPTPTQSAIQAPQAGGEIKQMLIKFESGVPSVQPDGDVTGEDRVDLNVDLTIGIDLVPGIKIVNLSQPLTVTDAKEVAAELTSDPGVAIAEPNYIVQANATAPNDQYWSSQFSLWDTYGLNVLNAWDITRGSSNVVVAVLDTGSTSHPDLNSQYVPGYDFISNASSALDGDGRDSNPQDMGTAGWHGTHVSGTIAAATNNNIGIAGVAPNVKIQPVRVLGRNGSGTFADIISAIYWASGSGVSGVANNPTPAKVINMSLGGNAPCTSLLQQAINIANQRGTTVVVSAGNSNTLASSSAPANCNNVITVASIARNGNKAYYSNYGPAVEISAPGGDTRVDGGIISTLNSGSTSIGSPSYAKYQGTSMAAPHVSGAVALLLSKNPNLTPSQVTTLLQQTAKSTPCGANCGAGTVDVAKLLGATSSPTPTPTTSKTASPTPTQTVTPSPTTTPTTTPTPSPTKIYRIPTTPRGLWFSSTTSSIRPYWVLSQSDGPITYTANFYNKFKDTNIAHSCTSTKNNCLISNLPRNTVYWLSVTASTNGGTSAPSSRIRVLTTSGLNIPINQFMQRDLAIRTKDSGILDVLINSGNDVIRVAATSNVATQSSSLARVVDDGNDYVRVAVARHKNTTNQDLQILSSDGNYYVALFANQQLKTRGLI